MENLSEVLKLHALWLTGVRAGVRADLSGADLSGADLRDASLRDASLRGADLSGAILRDADLSRADLSRADLSGADLRDASLRDADLRDAVGIGQTVIAAEGSLIVWKKLRFGVIAKLRIPESARRSNATGRKCRAEFAEVLDLSEVEIGYSIHDPDFEYRVGATVHCDHWEEDRWQECAGGIHFFLTREEAEAYQ